MKNGAWRKSHYQVLLDDLAEMLNIPVLKVPMARHYFTDKQDKVYQMVDKAYEAMIGDRPSVWTRLEKFSKTIDALHIKYVARQSKPNPPYDDETHVRTLQTIFAMQAHCVHLETAYNNMADVRFKDSRFKGHLEAFLKRLVMV